MLEDYSEGETAAMESEMHIKEQFHCGELLEGYLLNEPWLRKSSYRRIFKDTTGKQAIVLLFRHGLNGTPDFIH